MMNGQVVSTDEVVRSARPSAPPAQISASTQPSIAANTTKTMIDAGHLSSAGRGGARQLEMAGNSVIAAAPRTVQAR